MSKSYLSGAFTLQAQGNYLAARLKVSRTPLREALNRLEPRWLGDKAGFWWPHLRPRSRLTSPTRSTSSKFLERPSLAHWFGTNQDGRDVLSRTIFAARIDLFICAMGVLPPLLVGVAATAATSKSAKRLPGSIDDLQLRGYLRRAQHRTSAGVLPLQLQFFLQASCPAPCFHALLGLVE